MLSMINTKAQEYIVYYTKDPSAPLSEWERKSVPGDADRETITVEHEDTPYVVRVQAATGDGPGMISEAYEVTTGKKRNLCLHFNFSFRNSPNR